MPRAPSPSSSEETTATSAPKNGFICTICFEFFPTGQALGGHQNAHHLERSFRQTTPNILGAVLNHPLPQDDLQALASNLAASGHRRHLPPKNLSKRSGKGGDDDRHDHPLEGRVRYGSPHRHPYERRPPSVGSGVGVRRGGSEAPQRKRMTKNLLGKWKPVRNQGETVATANADMELELSLKRNEIMDLNLKLGF